MQSAQLHRYPPKNIREAVVALIYLLWVNYDPHGERLVVPGGEYSAAVGRMGGGGDGLRHGGSGQQRVIATAFHTKFRPDQIVEGATDGERVGCWVQDWDILTLELQGGVGIQDNKKMLLQVMASGCNP